MSLTRKPLGIRLARQAALWTVVCWAAAGPSFFIAMMIGSEPGQRWGVVAGVFTFIVLYTIVSCLPRVERLRHDKAWRLALRVGYGLRIAVSAVSPVVPYVMVLDIRLGVLSVQASSLVWGFGSYPVSISNWASFYLTTLIHGVLLNLALLPVILIAWGVFRAIYGRTPPLDSTRICITCGYDLRASLATCPECGTLIPPPAAT